jgi:hypothetical protein
MTRRHFRGPTARVYQNEFDRLVEYRASRSLARRFIGWLRGESYYDAGYGSQAIPYESRDLYLTYNSYLGTAPEMLGVLRDIPKVGPKKAQAIYYEYGSLDEILQSSIERLASVRTEGGKLVGMDLAVQIWNILQQGLD